MNNTFFIIKNFIYNYKYIILVLCLILVLYKSNPNPSQNIHIHNKPLKISNDNKINSINQKSKLMPILEPTYNMREICKNMLLLEDHLFQREKRCKQCIKKHFLLIEAFSEEMITLDIDKNYTSYYDLPNKIRQIERNFLNGDTMEDIAQQLRIIRKDLIKQCFESF